MKYGSSSHLQIIEESFEGPIIHSNDRINQRLSHRGAGLATVPHYSAILGRRRPFAAHEGSLLMNRRHV